MKRLTNRYRLPGERPSDDLSGPHEFARLLIFSAAILILALVFLGVDA